MIVFITLILVQLCASESLEEVPIQPRACDGSCDYYQNPNNCAEVIKCDDPTFSFTACLDEGQCFDDGLACGCVPERGCPENCQYYQTEDTCPQFQNCHDLELIESCPPGNCFSELYCSCISDAVPCTGDCNRYPGEHPDGCLGYRHCETEMLYRCPDGLCFDESICGCSEDANPNPPGTPATPSPECPCKWLSVPNGDCREYVDCYNPGPTMFCPEDAGCYSEEACCCVDGPTCITGPTNGPPNCGSCSFMPVGPSSCSGYTPCPDGYPTYYCNPGLCFNEDTCSCESQQQVVCEEGCPYGPGSATDCQWYTDCTTGESFVCPGITCFQPTQCTCA